MSTIGGFEVVPKPSTFSNRCKYAELFDAAIACGDGECVAKDYGSADVAELESTKIRHSLYYWQKQEKRWEGLMVRKSGSKLFVLKA